MNIQRLIIKIILGLLVIVILTSSLYVLVQKLTVAKFLELTKIGNDSSKTFHLPFTFEIKSGSHGSSYLGLLVGNDYPYNFYYYRSDNHKIIPNPGTLGEQKYDDISSEVMAHLPSDRKDSKLQVCNPVDICKTFYFQCTKNENLGPYNRYDSCSINAIPEITDRIEQATEIKIMHADVERTVDISGKTIDSRLYMFPDKDTWSEIKITIKIKSMNKTFEDQRVIYLFEKESLDLNELESVKSKLTDTARSLSGNAQVRIVEDDSEKDVIFGETELRKTFTITWDSNLDLDGLEDYSYVMGDFPRQNKIVLVTYKTYKYYGESYEKKRSYYVYSIDITNVNSLSQ